MLHTACSMQHISKYFRIFRITAQNQPKKLFLILKNDEIHLLFTLLYYYHLPSRLCNQALHKYSVHFHYLRRHYMKLLQSQSPLSTLFSKTYFFASAALKTKISNQKLVEFLLYFSSQKRCVQFDH